MAAMASSRTFPLLFLLLSLIRGGASTLGYALLPQHLLAQHNHTSWNNHARAPPQLNRTSFARCLSAAGAFSPSELPDLRLMRSAHDLKVDDGLLMYLSLYAGQRFPKINETWQQPAYLRWSTAFEAEEASLIGYLETLLLPPANTTASLSPRLLFRGAAAACNGSLAAAAAAASSKDEGASGGDSDSGDISSGGGGEYDYGPQGDSLCAAVVCHNVLRALGRRDTYVDLRTGVDYAPAWLLADEAFLMDTFAPLVQAAMLPLRNDGGGDGWGEWYHTFGLLAWGTHGAALFPLRGGLDGDGMGRGGMGRGGSTGGEPGGSVAAGVLLDAATAYADTLVAVIVTPDHTPEDPVKARVDDDNAGVLRALLTQKPLESDEEEHGASSDGEGAGNCDSEAGYVLPAPPSPSP